MGCIDEVRQSVVITECVYYCVMGHACGGKHCMTERRSPAVKNNVFSSVVAGSVRSVESVDLTECKQRLVVN